MPLISDNAARRRRRGAALEHALLDAAWQEIVERGYDALTIEGVAERAGTSRAVLYRRWPTKPQLVHAALLHAILQGRREPPDTGSLRGDLSELMRRANDTRVPLVTVLSVQLGHYFAETETNLAELRESLLRSGTSLDVIYARAAERGEIDPARLTPRLRRLPFDLFRHEILMTLSPVPDEAICQIIDEVFLPLVRPAGCGEDPAARP